MEDRDKIFAEIKDIPEQDLVEFARYLRAFFTNWLKTLLVRKKINEMIRRRRFQHEDVSLENLSFDSVDPAIICVKPSGTSYAELFEFENKRLEKAFLKLPERSQQILAYLYVYEWKPQEIAVRIAEKTVNVYAIKHRALTRLRKELCGEQKKK